MKTPENKAQADMQKVLREEINATRVMIETLAQERQSIIDTDADALLHAVQEKDQALERLQQLELQRISLLEAAGFSADPNGMAAFLELGNDRNGIPSLWQQLMEQTANCREQNRENFQLVETYSCHTHQVLSILRGEEPTQATYGPAGTTRDRHERRSLAKA